MGNISHVNGYLNPIRNGELETLHTTRPVILGTAPTLDCPKGPCTQIVYTLAPKYLYGDYFKANVYTIWVHGPLGLLLYGGSNSSVPKNLRTHILRLLGPKTMLYKAFGLF